jgi:hypothetical protein
MRSNSFGAQLPTVDCGHAAGACRHERAGSRRGKAAIPRERTGPCLRFPLAARPLGHGGLGRPHLRRQIGALQRSGLAGPGGTADDLRDWLTDAGLRVDRLQRSGAVVHFAATLT